MKETLIGILTSYYFWIAIELIIIAVLLYLVTKLSRLKKASDKEYGSKELQDRYRELDDMLANKRSER